MLVTEYLLFLISATLLILRSNLKSIHISCLFIILCWKRLLSVWCTSLQSCLIHTRQYHKH